MPKIILFMFVFFLFADGAVAQELVGREGDWRIYSIRQDGKKVCYLAASPVKSAGSFRRRGDPYFLVTYKNKGQQEISASSGYPYKKSSDVHLTFSKNSKYRLFTRDDLSWARDAKTDKAIVQAMKKGWTMKVRGTSRLKTFSEDTYSLRGFSKALERMESACD